MFSLVQAVALATMTTTTTTNTNITTIARRVIGDRPVASGCLRS
jgi:hypothetical protein